ncbi:hypothetical protein MKX68_25630 [Paenibacillus sp. FSL M8-0212]|uniref:hypothetical protein n=1 Tax=Paenibacillus sp. FSL M8-0212 TaxID=2921618 RepID=UPI0030FA6134
MKKVFLSCLAMLIFLIPFSPVTSASGDRLIYDTMYNVAGRGLVSDNNRFSFQFDNWGDAQLWDVKTRTMLWNSKTKDMRIHKLQIRYFSGKLEISDPQNTPYWTSDNLAWAKAWYGADNVPANLRGNVLIMQNDGNLVLYNNENPAMGWYPVWASNTGGH